MEKKNNGITLIALVITIIVLLILAGVTINLTLGQNGIFTTAQKAAKNYTNAQEKELADINNFDNTVKVLIQNITEENNVANTPEMPNYEILASKAKSGDYVQYTPTAKTFSMTPEQTGQDENQDFSTADYTGLWQVLYNDNEHGLQIISAGNVENLTLGHEDSDGSETIRTASDEEKVIRAYNNAVSTLNSFCKNYVNEAYATTGRCVGSDPINPDSDVTETVTLQFTPNGYADGKLGLKAKDEKYQTDYDAMTKATSQNANGIHNIGKYYWLASRNETCDVSWAVFVVRCLSASGEPTGYGFWNVDSTVSRPYSGSPGVRPVITLKADIKTSSGDGSASTPYKLVAQ